MRWRSATLQLIYEKSLRLDLSALSRVSAGHVISMAASDLERFQKACQYLCVRRARAGRTGRAS